MKAKWMLCSCQLSVVAAAICVVPCQAAEYYVDATHAQAADENAGRETSPWKTISRAVQVARAGDTVWIKAGKYREGVRYFAHSGEYYASELRFITLAAYRNDAVIIDGSRKVDPGEWKLKEGAKNVFWIALPEDPNQVFVDGARLAEAIEVKVEDKLDAERGTQRTTTRREIAVTDATPGKWLYDEKTRRLTSRMLNAARLNVPGPIATSPSRRASGCTTKRPDASTSIRGRAIPPKSTWWKSV